jgi:choice-of-anchor B domain-containing protein
MRVRTFLLASAVGIAMASSVSRACDVRTRVYAPESGVRLPDASLHDTPCVGGLAGGFPCSNVDLVDYLPISTFAVPGLPLPATASMIWGYTDPQTGKEYALLGMNNSLAIVLLDGPGGHAQLIGRLPTHTGNSIWRDVRTYREHAYITSDSNGAHGMQILDLRQLRSIANAPIEFTETAHYSGIRNTHTIAINESSGFAYLAGTNTCGTGIHIVDIRNPTLPVFAGCFGQDGYTHETQCWNYQGPDTEHVGKEICLAADVDALVAVNATNKAAPAILSSITYPTVGYVHQAWFTQDFRYALLNDELDEQNQGTNGKTYVFDYADLDAPVLRGTFVHPRRAIDHNLYIKNNFVYESNYTSGLRILNLGNLANAQMNEVGFFDVYPANDGATFNGNWGNYPFFASGRVVLSGIGEGLFVVKPNICSPPVAPAALSLTNPAPNTVTLNFAANAGTKYRVQRAVGGCSVSAAPFETIASDLLAGSFSDTSASGGTVLGYRVQSSDSANACAVSSDSPCVEITPTGLCTAPPRFNGVASAAGAQSADCAVNLGWLPALSSCGNPVQYQIYGSTDAVFNPSAATLLGVSGLNSQSVPTSSAPMNYVVRAKDTVNSAQDTNLIVLKARATGPLSDASFTSGAEIGDVILNEGSVEGFDATERHVGWHISSTEFRSGARSYESTIGSNYCLSLETPSFTLTPGQFSEFSFWTKHGLPTATPIRDGGALEISIDGGPWTEAPLDQPLNAVAVAGNACRLAIGRKVFNGTAGTWAKFSANLQTLAGRSVRFRFLLATGASVPAGTTGWFVDDVSLTHAQVPGPCTPAGADTLYRNGFE